MLRLPDVHLSLLFKTAILLQKSTLFWDSPRSCHANTRTFPANTAVEQLHDVTIGQNMYEHVLYITVYQICNMSESGDIRLYYDKSRT